MTKGDVFLIIAQIYIVGGLIINGERKFLYTIGSIWLIMSFIAWGVK